MLKLRPKEPSKGVSLKLDQARLDITSRSRTSRLPWRGQFSPEFIEYIMDELCSDADVFYDPFCGSGTVLFEALHRSRTGFGTEVNPAAWHLAALSSFSGLSSVEQTQLIYEIRKITASSTSYGPLFSENSNYILNALKDGGVHPFLRTAIAAIILVGMGNSVNLDDAAIERGASTILSILKELASKPGRACCFLADARKSPLKSKTVDAVITSPPYINVFNYHQYYRPAAELIGWQPLQAASSEIGANRKHRQNRFLTVIQYCLDMAMCISETSRTMKYDAPLVIILGRTSNVLGASFRNGDIISDVIDATNAFLPLEKAERSFTNRFGERIYEDIIFARRNHNEAQFPDERLRQIGISALQKVEALVQDKNLASLIDAIEKAQIVKSSQMLSVSVPAGFEENCRQRAF